MSVDCMYQFQSNLFYFVIIQCRIIIKFIYNNFISIYQKLDKNKMKGNQEIQSALDTISQRQNVYIHQRSELHDNID